MTSKVRAHPILVILCLLGGAISAQEDHPTPGAPPPPTPGETEALPLLPLTIHDLPRDRDPIYWRSDWQKASIEAKERNVPIYLVVMRDGDALCDMTRESLWTNREYRGVVDDECVPVIVILPPDGDGRPHSEIPADPEGGSSPRCSVVPTLRCAQHDDLTGRIPLEWRGATGMLPERRLLDAEGSELVGPEALPPGMGTPHLTIAARKARESLGERRATRIQYRFALVRLARIREGLELSEYQGPSLDLNSAKRDFDSLPATLVAHFAHAEGELRARALKYLSRGDAIAETEPAAARRIYKRVYDEFPGMPEALEALGKYQKIGKQ